MNGYEGCPVYSLDASLVGYVSAATRTRGRGRGCRIVNGRRVPNAGGGRGSGRSGHPTRILAAGEIRTFLSDPTKFARRDCWLGVKGLQALTKPLAEAYGIEKPGGLVIGECLLAVVDPWSARNSSTVLCEQICTGTGSCWMVRTRGSGWGSRWHSMRPYLCSMRRSKGWCDTSRR